MSIPWSGQRFSVCPLWATANPTIKCVNKRNFMRNRLLCRGILQCTSTLGVLRFGWLESEVYVVAVEWMGNINCSISCFMRTKYYI